MAKLSYSGYLQLPRLLSCQTPESTRRGAAAHDEMLFIVTHQSYELWFKQILHELDAVLGLLAGEFVAERELGLALRTLERVSAIQRVLLEQIAVLETMTPLDFLDFRHLLTPSSGFQSAQFRRIENKLGLLRGQRLSYNDRPYDASLVAEERAAVLADEAAPSLFDLVEAWLARTPFVSFQQFDFWFAYRASVAAMLAQDRATIEQQTDYGEAARAAQLDGLARIEARFAAVFDPASYDRSRAAGERRLSYAAFVAALMISLYRDEPILQQPFRLLTGLIQIDENLSLWRTRHALMVSRMIGSKIGTGGSSGQAYLAATVDAHRIFGDLFELSTFFVPRSMLPALPAELQKALGFHWRP